MLHIARFLNQAVDKVLRAEHRELQQTGDDRLKGSDRRCCSIDLMTLVSSVIRNDLHVWAYIKGVLDALLAGYTDYHSLRPDVWATTHPEHIRTYRKDERRDRADRKQLAREERRNATG